MLKQKTKKIHKQMLRLKKAEFIRSLYFYVLLLELKINNCLSTQFKKQWLMIDTFSVNFLNYLKSNTIPTVTANQQSYEDIYSAMF